MSKEQTKMTRIEKIVARLKGGEDANVIIYDSAVKKAWAKNISNAEKKLKSLKDAYDDKIDELSEKLKEAEDSFDEAFDLIPGEKLQSDARAQHIVEVFEVKINQEATKVAKAKEAIEDVTAIYKMSVKAAQDSIDTFTKYLAKLD